MVSELVDDNAGESDLLRLETTCISLCDLNLNLWTPAPIHGKSRRSQREHLGLP